MHTSNSKHGKINGGGKVARSLLQGESQAGQQLKNDGHEKSLH